MRIAVVGSGAVGGYYGAKLARRGHEVTFIARGAHLRAIRERGLLVWTPLGDFLVRAAADEQTSAVGPVDLVLYAVKTYDNPTALPLLPPLLGPASSVLTLQNGVDSIDEVAAVVGERAVLGGATYIATSIAAPGVIEQTGVHRRVVFGEAFGERREVTPRVGAIAAAMREADIEAEAVADARVPLWEKFIYLAPFAAFTGAARLPIGPIWADPDTRRLFLAAVAEVERVARAEGVTVPDGVEDRVVTYMSSIPGETRSSLLIDLSRGRRIEVEALQGSVVRRGRLHGLSTPVMEVLYLVLRPNLSVC